MGPGGMAREKGKREQQREREREERDITRRQTRCISGGEIGWGQGWQGNRVDDRRRWEQARIGSSESFNSVMTDKFRVGWPLYNLIARSKLESFLK
jgi:hypothetical protein